MPTSIDVVVVAYNPYELTARCLACLREQTAPHQLIVVDNGSTDDTHARLLADWPEAHVVHLDVGCGFANACNLGVSAGSSEIVVLINNDVECRRDFLEHLTEPFLQDDQVGAAAPLLLQPGEHQIDSAGLVADRTLASFPRLQGLPVAERYRERPVLVGPTGAAAAYRRRAWEQLGGLDETIFAYMEDLDLDLRLRSHGWKAVMASGAVGVHLGSATHRHRSAAQRRHGGFGRGYLIRRYGLLHRRTGPRTILTETVVVLGDLIISHDLAALQGRLEGWRAGRGRPRLPLPPSAAIDGSISFLDSLALRRGVYGRRAMGPWAGPGSAHPYRTVSASRLRRKLGAWGPVRRFSDRPAVGHAIAAVTHGRLMRPSLPYVARELSGSNQRAAYRLRDGGVVVYLRHNTTDASIFDEIFWQRLYEPPPIVDEQLNALQRPLRMADLGANVGLFGAFAFQRWRIARLTAFEPHPANAALVRSTIEANGLGDRWTLIEACASTSNERLLLAIRHFSDSRVIRAEERCETPTSQPVDALDVFPLLADADVIKIDIEGGEWALLADPRFAELPATAIAIEYHPHLAPGPDARSQATRALERAGYTVQPVFHDPHGHGMFWAFRASNEPARSEQQHR